jgi:phenylacetate-CoA ligase
MTLQFRDVLLASERLPRENILDQQRTLLRKLLLHAKTNSPYYKARLTAGPLASKNLSEAWAEIPLLARHEVQKNFVDLCAGAIPPFAGKVEEGRTSGSTGIALRYLHEELMDVASAAQTDRAFEWWGLDGKKSLATFMSIYTGLDNPEGMVRGGGWRVGMPGGKRYIMELMVDIDRQLDWLKRVRPAYLFARGGRHIAELASRAQERKESIRFERIISGSSPMVPEARALARRIFKAEIADMYGASETGLIACSCPDCGLLHVCDETILVEILREDRTPCEPGETGRVVLTPLYAYAMPLLRYEIGDFAVRGPDKPPCGRGLSSIISVAGRYRGVFYLKDGRVLHPYAASSFAEVLSFRQIQIVQTDYDQIEIRYVPKDPNIIPIIPDVERFVRDAFDQSFKTTLKAVERFDLPAGGKFEETLSLVRRPEIYGPPSAMLKPTFS